MADNPRISIVIPSLNQGTFLEQALLSVLEQDYRNVEILVIDGESKDDSRRILELYGPRLKYWVSEPDLGQVDAINKGLARASGDIVAFLNSDDLYIPGALTCVARHFTRHASCRWLVGDGYFLLWPEGREFFEVEPPRTVAAAAFLNYRMFQPSVFWTRAVFEEHGYFDARYSYCFDHEFYVRLLAAGEQCEHVSRPLSCFRLHPASKTVSQANRFGPEMRRVRRQYIRRLFAISSLPDAIAHARREAGYRLVGAVSHWRKGDRRGALALAAGALALWPPTVLKPLARRALRLALPSRDRWRT